MNYLVKTRTRRWLPALLLSYLLVPGMHGQATAQPAATELQSNGALDPGAIVHEIDDPSSGVRWLLVRSGDRPGGPGRMLLLSAKDSVARTAEPQVLPGRGSYVPVIRAGDTVVVEEHTGVADARLESVALGPALAGATLRLRLKLGGRIVRASASGPGHATLIPETEAWQ